MDDLPQRLIEVPVAEVTGTWLRYCPARYASTALDGRTGYGRWGTAGGFSVLYLGNNVDTVVVEAYRHLVDPIEDLGGRSAVAKGIHGLVLVHAKMRVTDVLDLRGARARWLAGLTLEILQCDTGDADGYAACQRVAQVAHQLGRHGVVAPAATGCGETLALFPGRLAAEQRPVRDGEDDIWNQLPPDPRSSRTPSLRVVTEDPS